MRIESTVASSVDFPEADILELELDPDFEDAAELTVTEGFLQKEVSVWLDADGLRELIAGATKILETMEKGSAK